MKGIIEILQKWNLWERKISSGVKREKYIKKIMPFMERKEVLVLKGIRRSGKSTLLRQLMEELLNAGKDKKQILYLNLEDYGFADNLTLELFDEVLDTYQQYAKNKGKVYFFIDEIQKISSWEKWIRTKYDLGENIKFILSGSSASLLSKELSTLLTGRNLSFTVLPLSFSEFLLFSPSGNTEEYFHYGGFPEVVLEKSEEKKTFLLQQYFEDIIHKDIIDRYAIRNTKQVMELARYLVAASGSKVRHDIAKLPKFYCLDLGLINAIQVRYSKNVGQMFENAVLIKLVEQYSEISYWGDGESEVDFVAGKTAINVTSSNEIPLREEEGLKKFSQKHQEFILRLITKSLKKENIFPLEEFLEKELV